MLQAKIDFDKYYGADIVGVDEAGLGPLVGPIVACAARILDISHIPDFIDDSKKVLPRKREAFVDSLTADTVDFSIAVVSVEEINALGLGQAHVLALTRVVEKFAGRTIILDGNRKIPGTQTIIKGDEKSLAIGVASIIAKVTRDRMMLALHEEYPIYGWDKNKGYGTQHHLSMMKEHGITPHHRMCFEPVSRYHLGK